MRFPRWWRYGSRSSGLTPWSDVIGHNVSEGPAAKDHDPNKTNTKNIFIIISHMLPTKPTDYCKVRSPSNNLPLPVQFNERIKVFIWGGKFKLRKDWSKHYKLWNPKVNDFRRHHHKHPGLILKCSHSSQLQLFISDCKHIKQQTE